MSVVEKLRNEVDNVDETVLSPLSEAVFQAKGSIYRERVYRLGYPSHPLESPGFRMTISHSRLLLHPKPH